MRTFRKCETMDRFDAMAILVACVKEGSFSAAGRKLGIPLPTVSRKVADLEEHLKTRLLVRSTRKLALTEAGVNYVAACSRILEDIAEAEAEAAGEYTMPRGDLTITAPMVFGRLHVVPVVNEFLARFADINVRMMLSERNVGLIEDHVDVAARIGELPNSTLIATRLGSVRRIVCGSPVYFAAHGVPKTLDDLYRHQCVTFSEMRAGAGASWIFKSRGRQPKFIQPLCRLHINTAEAAIDAAISGVGITNVLSYQAAQAVNEQKLIIVLQEFEPPPIPVHLVHAHQRLLPLKMRRFLEFAAPRIRKSVLAMQEQLDHGTDLHRSSE
jgi:DNA-binding transcriptional LysR family regulator